MPDQALARKTVQGRGGRELDVGHKAQGRVQQVCWQAETDREWDRVWAGAVYRPTVCSRAEAGRQVEVTQAAHRRWVAHPIWAAAAPRPADDTNQAEAA